MGWMDLSCPGSDFYRTPNVDHLANEGIRFTNGYAACTVAPLPVRQFRLGATRTVWGLLTGSVHSFNAVDWERRIKILLNMSVEKTESFFALQTRTGWKVLKSLWLRI